MNKTILVLTGLFLVVIFNCFLTRQIFFGNFESGKGFDPNSTGNYTVNIQPYTKLKSDFVGQFKYSGWIEGVEKENFEANFDTKKIDRDYGFLSNNLGFWGIIESSSLLEIGRPTAVLATVDLFSESMSRNNSGQGLSIQGNRNQEYQIKSNSYYLSSGIEGGVKIKQKISPKVEFDNQYYDCNWQCLIISQSYNLRQKISYILDTNICRVNNWINISSGQKCKEVLAWSYGLVVGSGDLFDKTAKDNLKTLGLSHLIVVSGSHVGLVVALITWLLTKIKFSRRVQFPFVIIGILGLIAIVGPQPPVLRSSIAVILSMFVSIFLGRKINGMLFLVYSGLILLMLNPWLLWSVSFWLSVLASLGISVTNILFNNNVELCGEIAEIQFWHGFRSLFLSCIGSFLFTLPIVAILSGKISILGLFTNLLVVPQIPILSLLNFLAVIPFIGELAIILAQVWQNLLINFLNSILGWEFSKYFVINIGTLDTLELIGYYVVLTIGLWLVHSGIKQKV
jgi:ComEC/Rec2-related protein